MYRSSAGSLRKTPRCNEVFTPKQILLRGLFFIAIGETTYYVFPDGNNLPNGTPLEIRKQKEHIHTEPR